MEGTPIEDISNEAMRDFQNTWDNSLWVLLLVCSLYVLIFASTNFGDFFKIIMKKIFGGHKKVIKHVH